MYSCKEYAAHLKEKIRKAIEESGISPKLVVLQIGDNPSSNSYIKGKKKDCEEVGIKCEHYVFGDKIHMNRLIDEINELNSDESVSGIILQLPVPDHIDVKTIQNLISSTKDVDGFSAQSKFQPCTPLGVINYLKFIEYDFTGKNACVVGRSDIVGKPLAKMLLDLNCTVTICHSKTPEHHLAVHMSDSNIVFTCINEIEKFDHVFLSPLSDIIDIGLGIGTDGKLHGNIHRDTVKMFKESADPLNQVFISGVGGVGLLTRATLLTNTLKAYYINNNISAPEWL